MGFSLSWVAVRGKPKDALRRELGLTATGAREAVPESPLLSADLAGGWTLLIANNDMRYVDEALLAKLSVGAEAVACVVEEHVMMSHASGWTNGTRSWLVDHDGSNGPGELDAEGALPQSFAAIRKRLEEEQRASGRDVDYLFDAPVDLALSLVGFRHDQDIAGAEGDPFEVLAADPSPAPRKSFWAKLFG